MQRKQNTPTGPVTVIVSRRVRPGYESAFEDWLSGIAQEALTFEGHLGINILKPSAASHDKYVVIFRFDSYEHLQAWEESPECVEWVRRVDDLTVGNATIRKITGMEYWFTLPNQCVPPPRYKMAMVSALAIFPLINILAPLFHVMLGGIPALLRSLLLVVTMVILMTYFVMPFMTRLFAWWLFKTASSDHPL